MKSTRIYHKNHSAEFGLTFILAICSGGVQADKPLLITIPDPLANVWKPAIDIKTPLADSFVFMPTRQHQAVQKIRLALVQPSYSYITDQTKWPNDHRLVASSFQKPDNVVNKPLRMITDSIKQRNYLVVGSKISAPLINGVYAYLAYHQAENILQDNSRQLSFGGRLEF